MLASRFRLFAPLLALLLGLAAVACSSATGSAPPPTSTPEPTAPSNAAALSSLNKEKNVVTLPSPSSQPSGAKTYNAPPPMTLDLSKTYTATIDTSLGTMTAELFAKEDPLTVNNFVFLSRQGFYNGVTFHRVIQGFMVQTGDPTGTGTGGPGYRFNDEPVHRQYLRGTVAMANAGPNTNGSQFFIVQKDTPLPPNYTIFGMLTGNDSLTTLDKIAAVPTGPGRGGPNTPKTPVTISSIEIMEK